jgi:phage-related minor tail protein
MARKNINLRAGWDLDAFSKSGQNLERSLKKTADKMKSIGASMSTYVTAPLVAMGGLAVKVFADFEQSMAKVAAVSGATGGELAKLTKLAKDLGISTRFTATEVADLQLNYAKLGFSSAEIEKITGATLSLALATGEDLASSAETAGATLRGFQMDASEMQKVIDVMAKSFSTTGLKLEKFQVAMSYVAPVANAANVSLEKSTAMLGALVDSGVKASTAGTSLRQIFTKLAKGGMTYQEAMDKIKNSTDKVRVANELFGDEAFASAIILAEQQDKVNDLTESFENSAGAAKAMADIMDNTLEGSMLKVKSAVEGLGISFGEILAPHVTKIAAVVSSLAIRFSELDPETKKIIVVVAALAAGIGPLIFAIGALTAALAYLAANPIVLIIAAWIVYMGALVAAFIYVRNNLDAFADKFYNAWIWLRNTTIDSIKGMLTPIGKLMEVLGLDIGTDMIQSLDKLKGQTIKNSKEFGSFKDAVKDTVGYVKKEFGEIVPKVEEVVEPLDKVKTKLKEIKFELNDILGGDLLAKLSSKPIEVKIPIITDASSLKGLKDTAASFRSSISSSADAALDYLTSTASMARQKAFEIGASLSTSINEGLQSLAANGAALMGEFMGSLMSGGDMTIQDFGKGILASIGQFMSDFGKAMIAIGIAEAGIKLAISTMNPVLAIAGGIALVAAGAALSNVAKAGIDSSSGGGGGGNAAGGSYTPNYGMSGMSANMEPIIMDTRISGRDMIITQSRERQFKR